MKKILLLILMILPLSLTAQRFTGGITGGLNVSQIEGDTEGGYRKAGLVGGAFVKTDLREKWGGLLEIRFAEKGSALTTDDGTLRIRLQYIELPLLATYDAFDKIQAQAGVAIGYLFKQVQNDGSGNVDIDDYNPYEVASAIGINYLFLDNLAVNLRLTFSMIPIQQDYPGATSIRKKEASFNNALSFTLNYKFGR